jgi:hypothetical protein
MRILGQGAIQERQHGVQNPLGQVGQSAAGGASRVHG